MTKIPIVDDVSTEELRCTTCLLPMQYQTKKDGKFLWQCFKYGKQVHSRIGDDFVWENR